MLEVQLVKIGVWPRAIDLGEYRLMNKRIEIFDVVGYPLGVMAPWRFNHEEVNWNHEDVAVLMKRATEMAPPMKPRSPPVRRIVA